MLNAEVPLLGIGCTQSLVQREGRAGEVVGKLLRDRNLRHRRKHVLPQNVSGLRAVGGVSNRLNDRYPWSGNSKEIVEGPFGRIVESGACPDHRSARSEEHTSELQSLRHLVCRLLL